MQTLAQVAGAGLATALSRDSEGLASFHSRYVPAEAVAVPEALNALLPAINRCSACAACDQVCPQLPRANLVTFAGPMDICLRVLRHPGQLHLAPGTSRAVRRCGSCRRCAEACPLGLPLTELIRALQPVAQQLLERELATQSERQSGSSDPG